MVSRQDMYTGLFVAEYTSGGQTQATLRDAKTADGIDVGLLRLQFDLDIEKVLLQSGVPVLYGTPKYIIHPAAICGRYISDPDAQPEAILNTIVYLELVDDTPDRLVTYAFRLDGADYTQPASFPVPSGKLRNNMTHNGQVRLACRYVYFPETGQLTITATQSGGRIHVPDVVIPQLLDRLPYDVTEGTEGVKVPIMSTTGVIEGQLQADGPMDDGAITVPDVVTFEIGDSVHRLWTNRPSFRWLVDDQLVTPISSTSRRAAPMAGKCPQSGGDSMLLDGQYSLPNSE